MESLQRREKSVSSPLMELKQGLSRYSVILLQENTASTGHLKALVVYRVCNKLLHPNGTVIVSLPLPYYKHVGRIVGECALIRPQLLLNDDGGL